MRFNPEPAECGVQLERTDEHAEARGRCRTIGEGPRNGIDKWKQEWLEDYHRRLAPPAQHNPLYRPLMPSEIEKVFYGDLEITARSWRRCATGSSRISR